MRLFSNFETERRVIEKIHCFFNDWFMDLYKPTRSMFVSEDSGEKPEGCGCRWTACQDLQRSER